MGMLTRQRSTLPSTIERLRDEFDRALSTWWNDSGEFAELATGWQPSVDIAETDQALEVKVDLPGIKPEEVQINVSDNRLIIQGERKEEKETKDKTVHRIERRYGSFYRAIPLPAGTKPEEVSAESDNGVITVRVPKAEQAKAKRVAVKPK